MPPELSCSLILRKKKKGLPGNQKASLFLLRPILGLILTLLALPAGSAAGGADAEALSTKASAWEWAETEKLYLHPTWLNLHRYKKSLWRPRWSSDVSSPEFFVSLQGRGSPKAEMQEFLLQVLSKAGKEEKDREVSSRVECRFPARFKWLREQLPKDLKSQMNFSLEEECPLYRRWRLDGQVESISLVFATGYFGNPASYFGHPLLKFNAQQQEEEDFVKGLLDVSLNYGAMTPLGENPISYVLKGLLGGYRASFSHIHYFYHQHNYSETELRDLWEYRLNLPAADVEFIVDHSFELLGQSLPYFFFSDNCAFRMAELLDMVLPEPILNPHLPYAIPTSLFQRLVERENRAGEALVSEVNYWPSRQRRMAQSYLALGPQERADVLKVARRPQKLSQVLTSEREAAEQAPVLESLLEYFSFRDLQDGPSPLRQEARRQILLERLKLPSRQEFLQDQPRSSLNGAIPPHKGQRPMQLSFGVGRSLKEGSEVVELSFRPALYDQLSLPVAAPPGSELALGEVQLVYQEGQRLRLQSFDIFSISTLNIGLTNLPGDGNWAWRMRLGFWSRDLACETCLVGGIEGGVGRAWSLASGLNFYALLKARIQSGGGGEYQFLPGPLVGFLFEPTTSWRNRIQYHYRMDLSSMDKAYPVIDLESRWGRSPHWDFGLRYRQEVERRLSFFVSHYW